MGLRAEPVAVRVPGDAGRIAGQSAGGRCDGVGIAVLGAGRHHKQVLGLGLERGERPAERDRYVRRDLVVRLVGRLCRLCDRQSACGKHVVVFGIARGNGRAGRRCAWDDGRGGGSRNAHRGGGGRCGGRACRSMHAARSDGSGMRSERVQPQCTQSHEEHEQDHHGAGQPRRLHVQVCVEVPLARVSTCVFM